MKKYAVITGASSGIGEEFAKRLDAFGFSLILVARRKERMQKLAKRIKSECEIITSDLSKVEECYRVFDCIKDKNVRIFINNAGFGDCSSFVQGDMEKELNMIDVNIRAVHVLTKLVLKKMVKEKKGYILNVASSAGLMPAGPFMAAYYASKSYVTSLTRAIAYELKEKKSPVYIGCLCPGPVDTEFNQVANVEFALKGIRPEHCVNCALKAMARKKVVIVPSLRMKLATMFSQIMPPAFVVPIVAMQQKKKMN